MGFEVGLFIIWKTVLI